MSVPAILQKLKTLAIEDQELYDLIETRFYPHPIQLELEDQQYPIINTRLMASTSFPDKKAYPIKSYLLDCYFISSNSLDEANAMYSRFYDIINNNRYSLDDGSAIVITEDSGIVDGSGIYGGQYLYVLTNTFEVRKIN